MEEAPKVIAFPRVISAGIKENQSPEVLEIKAKGYWKESGAMQSSSSWPVSLHITVYPGCSVIPVTGDHLKITIERCSSEEEAANFHPILG